MFSSHHQKCVLREFSHTFALDFWSLIWTKITCLKVSPIPESLCFFWRKGQLRSSQPQFSSCLVQKCFFFQTLVPIRVASGGRCSHWEVMSISFAHWHNFLLKTNQSNQIYYNGVKTRSNIWAFECKSTQRVCLQPGWKLCAAVAWQTYKFQGKIS